MFFIFYMIYFSFRFQMFYRPLKGIQAIGTVHRVLSARHCPERESNRDVPSHWLPPCRHRTLGTPNPRQQTLSMHLSHTLKPSHTLFVYPPFVPPCSPSSCRRLLGLFGHMEENQLLGVSAPSNWLLASDQWERGAKTQSFCHQLGRALMCDLYSRASFWVRPRLDLLAVGHILLASFPSLSCSPCISLHHSSGNTFSRNPLHVNPCLRSCCRRI